MHVTVDRGPAANEIMLRFPPSNPLPPVGKKVMIGRSPGTVLRHDGSNTLVKLQAGSLKIGERWLLNCRQADAGMEIGPVIGIFSSAYTGRKRRPVAGPIGRFRRLITEARRFGAMAYVFTPSGIDWRRRIIHGYTIRRGQTGGSTWVKGVFPFPNAIYNRVPTRRAESNPRVKRARQKWATYPDIVFFNPGFLNKWQVHTAIRHDERAKPFLPATERLGGGDHLATFLKRHRSVYLKQTSGSLGIGTIRLDVTPSNRVRWRQTVGKKGMRRRLLPSLTTLKSALRALPKRQHYIVQASVPLMTVDGRPFDIRALVQKHMHGTDTVWRVTGMAVRIAGRGQITTHRPRGGSRGRLQTVLTKVRSEKEARRIETQLQHAIEACATAFDDASDEQYAELSLDVGIDAEGHPWVLEINAKPMVFDEPAIRGDARRHLIKYCFERNGFRWPGKPRTPRRL